MGRSDYVLRFASASTHLRLPFHSGLGWRPIFSSACVCELSSTANGWGDDVSHQRGTAFPRCACNHRLRWWLVLFLHTGQAPNPATYLWTESDALPPTEFRIDPVAAITACRVGAEVQNNIK